MQILFGTERPVIDGLIHLGCFLIIFKNLIHFSAGHMEGSVIMHSLISFLVTYRIFLEITTFLMGGLFLAALSVYIAKHIPIKKPSLMHIIHDEGPPPTGISSILRRSLTIFSVLIFFFIIIFNFGLEWLGMLMDAPLILLALLIYIFVIIRHHQRFHVDHLLFKVGNVGEAFYERFIALFQRRETIALGISGILVLHLLTEFGTFAVPLFGFSEVSYFIELGGSHIPLVQLFIQNASGTMIQRIVLGLLYLGNTLALLFFLLTPAFIWHKVYQNKGFKVSHLELSLFYFAASCYLVFPLFLFKSINASGVAGVNIVTGQFVGLNPLLGILTLLIGGGVFALSYSHWIKERLLAVSLVLVDIFFAFYLFLFSGSIIRNYVGLITSSFTSIPGRSLFSGCFCFRCSFCSRSSSI
jgi:hypothetical protein